MNQVAVERVAFIGLGVMGYPMAGHLAAKGYQVTVFNRTEAKANQWVSEHGGSSAATPAEAARDAQAVFACVGNDDDIRAVTMGPDGAFNGMSKGAVFIDHTTASAEVARALDAPGFSVVVLEEPPLSVNFQVSLPDGDDGAGIESLVEDAVVVPIMVSKHVDVYDACSLWAGNALRS